MAIVPINNIDNLTGVVDGDTVNITGGTCAIVGATIDLSGLAEGLTSMTVGRAFTGTIGSATASLKSDFDYVAASFLWYNAASGVMWYTPNGDNNLAHRVMCTSPGGTLMINGTGTITRLEVGQGHVEIGSGITVTNLHIAGGTVNQYGTGGTSPTVIEVTGGRYYTEKGAGTSLSVYGGDVTLNTTNTIATLTGACGRLSIKRSGTITQANFLGNLNLVTADLSTAVTITNSTIWASVAGASAFQDHSLITLTNPATLRIAPGNNY